MNHLSVDTWQPSEDSENARQPPNFRQPPSGWIAAPEATPPLLRNAPTKTGHILAPHWAFQVHGWDQSGTASPPRHRRARSSPEPLVAQNPTQPPTPDGARTGRIIHIRGPHAATPPALACRALGRPLAKSDSRCVPLHTAERWKWPRTLYAADRAPRRRERGGVPFGKVPFRTVQRHIEFHRGMRDRFGLDIATEIRNRLICTGAHTANDLCKGETVKRQRVGLTHWLFWHTASF